ncbi:MAG: DUF2254 domain-containing protein [Acidobacteria bacterium]|nr:DUF2254 domain-containing protein [Acidobacteriota bacterium]
MQKIRQFLINIRSSLWFVPGLMIIGSITLSIFLIYTDANVNDEWLVKYPRIFGLGADGSRGMLTAIAGSMLTVAALAFAMTLNIISQASAQYSPRVLRNFMRDRINQFVLGYFVSVFAYCLIVLLTIRGSDEIKFVPSLSVIAGLFFAIGGIIVLIYFIHHIADSLEATNIVKAIEGETVAVIDGIFPEKMGEGADSAEIGPAESLKESIDWHRIESRSDGYIQYVDSQGLMDFAVTNDVYLRMEYGIGQFVAQGTKLISVSRVPEQNWADEINSHYNIYRYRTIEQDVGYGIRQIVDIALKALSPGINDTTTAIICIDYLSVIVGRIAQRKLPASARLKDGEIRVFIKSPDFNDFVETAFDQIRISGNGNLAIFLRILKALSIIGEKTGAKDRLKVLERQFELTREFAEATLQTEYEQTVLMRVASKELNNIRFERV